VDPTNGCGDVDDRAGGLDWVDGDAAGLLPSKSEVAVGGVRIRAGVGDRVDLDAVAVPEDQVAALVPELDAVAVQR
jgi:hypothetical protein